MFYRLGQFVAAHAKAVLCAAALFVVVCALLGAGVFGRLLSTGFDDPSSSSSQAKPKYCSIRSSVASRT